MVKVIGSNPGYLLKPFLLYQSTKLDHRGLKLDGAIGDFAEPL